MPIVSINHITRYRCRREVAFGKDRILVRSPESYDQRLLSADLTLDSEPQSLRWVQDVFGMPIEETTQC